ncbi:MAG: response regulator transcription factor [Flavobacteriaceae bacterium]|nr:response regulator transcription factor [Flavobacteriaceae bacterium]
MKKILIVEDQIGVSQFLKQGLEEESFEVTVAQNGIDGLKYLSEQSFGLVLLDWKLPGMSGIEVCQKFRLKDTLTPVIFLTANDTLEDTLKGLRSGANDYIKKPFSFEELLERVKIHFRNNEAETPILTIDFLKINTRTHQVFRADEEINLTLKEYQLLVYLATNKGKVCTRKDIIKDIWNINFEYDTGVIDVFINSIRKKLDIKANKDLIKTIRGVGYMIVDEI